MSIISTFKTKRPYKSFWSAFLMVFVVFGLFQGFLSNPLDKSFTQGISPKIALASNNYIDNVVFTYDSTTYQVLMTFHVKTTFDYAWSRETVGGYARCMSGSYTPTYSNLNYWYTVSGIWYNDYNGWGLTTIQNGNECPDTTLDNGLFYITYTAGNTYTLYVVKNNGYIWYAQSPSNDAYLVKFRAGYTNPATTKIPNFFTDNADYDWAIEHPTLTITYPQNNAEIANIFDITGSFTQPAENPSSFLQVETMPTGTWSSSLQSFWTSINQATSGNFSITIGNLPSGYYDFRIYFRSGAFDFYQGALISNIHIVEDLPPFIPPWANQPPSTAPEVFQIISTSSISSSTGLYTTLTDVFAPVILSIAQNLSNFAQNFTQSNASSTGNQIGQSVLLVRSYLSNLNSFFGNFPVAQFLLLYLIALVVVIVLRLVKGLINLFKL